MSEARAISSMALVPEDTEDLRSNGASRLPALDYSDARTREPRRMTSLENEAMDPMRTTVRKRQALCRANRSLRHYEGIDQSVKQRTRSCGGEVWSCFADLPLPYNLTSDRTLRTFHRLSGTLA